MREGLYQATAAMAANNQITYELPTTDQLNLQIT